MDRKLNVVLGYSRARRQTADVVMLWLTVLYHLPHRTNVGPDKAQNKMERVDRGRRTGLHLYCCHSSWGRFGRGEAKLGCGLSTDQGPRFNSSWRSTHTAALGRLHSTAARPTENRDNLFSSGFGGCLHSHHALLSSLNGAPISIKEASWQQRPSRILAPLLCHRRCCICGAILHFTQTRPRDSDITLTSSPPKKTLSAIRN